MHARRNNAQTDSTVPNLEVDALWVDPGRDGTKYETGTGCDLIRK
jgi:hypothetical protein